MNSCFNGTDLESRINEDGIDLLFSIGVYTDSCLFDSMLDAKFSKREPKIASSMRANGKQAEQVHMMSSDCFKNLEIMRRVCDYLIE